MAKTPLFKNIHRLLKLSIWAEKKGIPPSALIEMKEQAEFTRREILKLGLTTVAATIPFAAMTSKAMATEKKKRKTAADAPVIIIGAGTAGLTAAYRLYKAGIPCEIYEGQSRVGGRMFTQHAFNDEAMFCERGGELVDTGHKDLIQLCKEVGIEMQSLVESDESLAKELYFIEGKLRTANDLLLGFRPLAKALAADLKSIYIKDSDLQSTPTYDNPFKSQRFDLMNLHDYLYSKKDVEKWVLNLVDVCYTGEYGSETHEQSAMNLLIEIGVPSDNESSEVKLLGVSDECMRIKGGSNSLPAKLAELLRDSVEIHHQHELLSIRDAGSHIILTFNNNGKIVEIKAEQIISAIPFTILRNIDGIFDLELNPRKKIAIKELGYGTNSKLMLGYKSRFWRTNANHKSTGIVYSDTESQEFWDTSRGQFGTHGIITSFRGGSAGKNINADSVQATINDFGKIFDGAKAQFDGNLALQHWPSFKWTLGSYISPKPGQYNSIIGINGEPELGGRLCFAGEHTSVEFGGFMNGAVQSGNKVAKYIVGHRKR